MKINNRQDSTRFTPTNYDDTEFKNLIYSQPLHDHMGLQAVLKVLIDAVVKRRNDYHLCSEKSYTSSPGPITFASVVSNFLKWWNSIRSSHLWTLYYYRKLPKRTDRKVLSSRSITHLSELRDYKDIEDWLRELTTRNKDFRNWTIFSWTHIKHLKL